MATFKKSISKPATEEKPVVAPVAAKVEEKKEEVKKVEAKKAEPKKEVKKAEPKKAAAKPAAAKKAEPKKTEVKKAEPKKAEPKKAAAKPAAKKVEPKTFVQVELDHVNYTEDAIIKLAKKAYKDSKKKEALKDLKVYFNTNERKLYVVPNNNIEEQIVVDLRLQ